MKILCIANEKGGVGKTMIAVQFAYYTAMRFSLKVALLDLDNQGTASSIIKAGNYAFTFKLNSADLLKGASFESDDVSTAMSATENSLLLISAPKESQELLSIVESPEEELEQYVSNFKEALDKLEPSLDLLIIDTNPNPDVRVFAALRYCDLVLSPIQLLQESVDGIGKLYQRMQRMASLNPKLKHGFRIIPCLVDSSQLQQKNGEEILSSTVLRSFLLPVAEYKLTSTGELNEFHSFGAVRKRSAFAQAQSTGQPVWKVGVRDHSWIEIKRPFFSLLTCLHIPRPNTAHPKMIEAVAECRRRYADNYLKLIRQQWLSGNPAVLVGLDIYNREQINLLREHIALDDLSTLLEPLDNLNSNTGSSKKAEATTTTKE